MTFIDGWIGQSYITKSIQGKQIKHNHPIAAFAPRKVRYMAFRSEHTFLSCW